MFSLALADADVLKDAVSIIADIIDEGTFRVDKNGLSLLAPDRTMVSVVDFRLPASSFEQCEGEASFGLNLANFVAVLKRAKSGDKLAMEQKGNRLLVRIGKGRQFELPILEINAEKPPVDQLSYAARVELDSSLVEDGIADADVIGDSVFFEATPELFRVSAKGEVSAAEVELGKKDKGVLKLAVTERLKAQYPLEYLKKMVKAAKLVKQVSLEFGNDYPLRMTFQAQDKVHLSFVLAPRVSNE